MKDFIPPSWEDVQNRIVEFSIKWRGIDLLEHPALKSRQSLAYDSELFNMNVAQFWGILPSKLSEVSDSDKVDIFAWYVAKQQFEAIEQFEYTRQTKRRG